MTGIRLSRIILGVIAFILVIGHNPHYADVAYAYEFIWSSEGNYLRWSADDIPVDYKIGNWWLPPGAIEPVGAVYAGYKAWEDVASASFSFNYQGTTTDVLPEGQDGVNMIAWNAEAYVGGIETGAIGATYIAWYDTTTLYYDEVDIALSIYYQWTTTGGANKSDIQGVACHEAGHLLGLGHCDVPTAAMIDGPTFFQTHTFSDTILMRTLDPDDIAGLSILYPPGYAGGGDGGGAGGGCFIATAVYGSGLSPEVRVLSVFRDRYLLRNGFGRKLMKVYYRSSPPLARFIAKRPVLRWMLRMHIKPFVKVARLVTR